MQEWLVVIHFIWVLTPMNWMDMGEDTVKEAQITIFVFHVQGGFSTFDELWGGDVR